MMEPLFTLDEPQAPAVGRHSSQKANGIHYTPTELAAFVARRALSELDGGELVVLDPACGDGELLLALAVEAAALGLPRPHLVGVDTDAEAIRVAADRLGDAPAASVVLRTGDFLAMGSDEAGELPDSYDLVISNPPYVRTQVLGAARAQALGKQFGLTGRVDLYHAFVAGMTAKLSEGGVLGLLCSNRFVTTKGGQSLRALLLRHYDIGELWDLGDTKLFEAAVLPAVVVARRTAMPSSRTGSFVRVYEDEAANGEVTAEDSLLAALESDAEGLVEVAGRQFEVERGELVEPSSERPWRLTSARGARWMEVVQKRSAGRFGDLGPIRVGIKTTADSVFIKATWDDLPADIRPESELVHPLLTHRLAARWRAEESAKGARFVLYPHEMRNGRKQAVDLARFPRAARYLELHRERLEGREYVRKAGRSWYEIWVPQQPDAWAHPKLVWPDISDRPKFFLDESGAIVNGDCYWLSCKGLAEDEAALALAVANSSFALRYYDLCCGNRLYAGRRRFITQYLEELPVPEAPSAALREVADMVSQLRDPASQDPETRSATEASLDAVVSELFGLREEVAR
ncbi:Eco57I restriction-modification methylase domain-containing protein [Capillimicrobium parvum]|uniref:site-specific DNA-methyltransferase (adenine-specific) n=1 Tax=Capillimicrobium parvum TaxID=2884022 RepID=A0A9E7BZL5_9ACTN|nr:methyltransferase domain-containing protein [Capillimicrobium parvum]UGS35505.1 Modification methylase PaeR7I [Capillimicrobium parvum]